MRYKPMYISIGITALNEGKNIFFLLNSILSQQLKSISIKEIIIISDGSEDDTVEKIRLIKDKRIKLIASSKREGKPRRLNQIFNIVQSEILILFDADVILNGNYVLEKLCKPFLLNKNVGLVCGKANPIEAENFIQEAVNISVLAYHELIEKLNVGNNLYACEGRIMALSKNLYKKSLLPPKIIATDAFLYFLCLKNKLAFIYVKNATVMYASPKNIREQIFQNKRFEARRYILTKYFGNLVCKESKIPKIIFYQIMFKYFLLYPISSLVILFINFYSKILAKVEFNKIDSLWSLALSTKGDIFNE